MFPFPLQTETELDLDAKRAISKCLRSKKTGLKSIYLRFICNYALLLLLQLLLILLHKVIQAQSQFCEPKVHRRENKFTDGLGR